MKVVPLFFFFFLYFSLQSFSQDTISEDTSDIKSPLKSLTDEEYSGFKFGLDMGMGRVAELNNYPAPGEVMKMGQKLGLSATQKSQLNKILDAWRFKTREMGGFILAQETKLNSLFAAGKATDGAVIYYTNKIGLYLGELRNAHLQAHLKTRNTLTREQIRKYYQIKGKSN